MTSSSNKSKNVFLENKTERQLPVELFENVLKIVIEHEKINSASFVNLLLTDDGSIRTYNKKYLGRDELTDVISFEADMEGVPLLGDIIIDVNVANLQRENRSLEQELQMLFLHGILHLIGYDHLAKTQSDIMRNKETEYIRLIEESI